MVKCCRVLILFVSAMIGLALIGTTLSYAQTAVSQEQTEEQKRLFSPSGLPIPRFVSLRSNKVFVRSGPARRYPVKWVFRKKGLPVEIIQEFDTWRKIRDHEGEEGWIHQSLLSGQRTILTKAVQPVVLQNKPGDEGRAIARVEPNVVAEVEQCQEGWCQIEAQTYRGWSPRKFLWGIYAGEELE